MPNIHGNTNTRIKGWWNQTRKDEYYEVGAREDFQFDDESEILLQEFRKILQEKTGIPEGYIMGVDECGGHTDQTAIS